MVAASTSETHKLPSALEAGHATLTVPSVTLPRSETELLWLDTVHRLAEQVDPHIHSPDASRLACYNLQVVLAIGAAVHLPLPAWLQALQDLLLRLPLSLAQLAQDSARIGSSPANSASSASSSPRRNLREKAGHNFSAGSCLGACNVVHELLLEHISRLRTTQNRGFSESWLRFCAVLSQNASFAKQHSNMTQSSASNLLLANVHDEVISIIISLLQMLRPPSRPEAITSEPSNNDGGDSGNMVNRSSGTRTSIEGKQARTPHEIWR